MPDGQRRNLWSSLKRSGGDGSAEGNWRWRCTEQMFTRPAFEWLRELKTTSSR